MTAEGALGRHELREWDGGWRSHDHAQLDAWCRATPVQRLAWLEEAMVFARDAILKTKRATVTRS